MSAPPPPPGRERAERAAPIVERLGLVVALSAALVKGIVAISGFPEWELDPFTMPAPSSGMGPAGSMLCDCVVILGAALLLVARWARGARVRWWDVLLFVGGGVGVAGLTFREASIGDQWIGSAWLGAFALGLGASAACQEMDGPAAKKMRAIVASVFVGFIALLAVRGAQQILIEHPATAANFKQNRETILAAQGWTPDSPMAKAYERRLSQPEATGWFGLANVYATFGAAGTVIAGVLFFGAVRVYRRDGPQQMSRGLLLGAIVPLIAGVGALALAGSKGGVVAMGLGVVAAIALMLVPARWPKLLGGVISVGALAATFGLVIVRGVVGDRLGELSILFRWFYMQAAVRIGVEHFPFGVGPDGFQTAYMLAKNPLSPEDVTSSHNMLLDLFATLGAFGAAWAVLWVLWIWRAGRAAATVDELPSPAPIDDSTDRASRWTVAAIGTIATFAAIRIDTGSLTPDLAVTRLAGLGAFCVAGWIVLALWERLEPRVTRVALTAGAIVGAAHALIDVAGVWPGSCAMLALLVGAAAAPVERRQERGGAWALVAALCAAFLGLCFFHAWRTRVHPWERDLRRAAGVALESGYLTQRWAAAAEALRGNQRGSVDEARALAAELQAQFHRDVRTPGDIDAAVREYDLTATREGARQLADLARRFPSEWKVGREASRLKLREASILESAGKPAEAGRARQEAAEVAVSSVVRPNAAAFAWLALVLESRDPGTGAAAEAMESAAKLAPYDLAYAAKLMHLHERAGAPDKARVWAQKALELDAGIRYDREVKQLSPKDREEAKRLAGPS